MAKQRQPKRYMRDTSIYDRLEDLGLQVDEKYCYLYLLLNRRFNFSGLYEIERRTIAFETGISRPRVESILERLAQLELLVYDNGLMFCPEIPSEQSFWDKSSADNILVNVRARCSSIRSELPKAENKAYHAWRTLHAEQLFQIDAIADHEASKQDPPRPSEPGAAVPSSDPDADRPLAMSIAPESQADDEWDRTIAAQRKAVTGDTHGRANGSVHGRAHGAANGTLDRAQADVTVVEMTYDEAQESDRSSVMAAQPPQKTGDPPQKTGEAPPTIGESPPETGVAPPMSGGPSPPHLSTLPPNVG